MRERSVTVNFYSMLIAAFASASAMIPASSWAANPTTTPCVKLVSADVLRINHFTGSGTVDLLLRNDTANAVELALTGSSSEPSTSVKIRFTGTESTSGTAAYIVKSFPPKSNLSVKLTVGEIWKDGPLDIVLHNHYGKEDIGKVHVERSPLAIGLVEPKLLLDLSKGNPSQVAVKNDGQLGYPSKWQIINGEEICSGHADFAPMSSSVLNCSPTGSRSESPLDGLLSGDAWLDAIKPDVPHDGYQLILIPDPPKDPSPLHTWEPVTVFSGQGSLHYWSPFWRTFWRYLVLFALLALGGWLSSYLSYFIPNQLLLYSAKDDLREVEDRSRDLSSKLDSKLLTNVRLQQRRLKDFLVSKSSSSPEFTDMVTKFQSALSLLSKRIDILQQVETVFVTLESTQSDNLPPTIIDEALMQLEKVKIALSKLEVTEVEISAAAANAAAALARVTPPNQIPNDFGNQLKVTLKAAVKSFQKDWPDHWSAYDYVKSNIGSLILSIEDLVKTDDPVAEADFGVASYLAEKAKIIATYIALRDNVIPPLEKSEPQVNVTLPDGTPEQPHADLLPVTKDKQPILKPQYSQLTMEMRERLEKHTEELFFFLHTFSLDGLRSAKLLIREMTEDIYAERIMQAIKNSKEGLTEVVIDVDPKKPRENSPLEIRVRFLDSRLDNSAAREEFRVTWDFGDRYPGEGWSIYHYYKDENRPTTFLSRFMVKKTVSDSSANADSKLARSDKYTVEAKVQRIAPVARNDEAHAARLVIPVTSCTIEVERAPRQNPQGRSEVERRKFWLTLLLAAVALIAGAESQLAKLDLIPGLIAVLLSGFTADSMKRLISDSRGPSH